MLIVSYIFIRQHSSALGVSKRGILSRLTPLKSVLSCLLLSPETINSDFWANMEWGQWIILAPECCLVLYIYVWSPRRDNFPVSPSLLLLVILRSTASAHAGFLLKFIASACPSASGRLTPRLDDNWEPRCDTAYLLVGSELWRFMDSLSQSVPAVASGWVIYFHVGALSVRFPPLALWIFTEDDPDEKI